MCIVAVRSLILSGPIHDDSIGIARLFAPGRQSVINIQRVRWNPDCGSDERRATNDD